MVKKLDLRADTTQIIGGIAKLAKSGVGKPISSLEMELPDDPVEGESFIRTVNVTQRLSEIDDVMNDANEGLAQARIDIDAAEAELAETQTRFDQVFVEHAEALAVAEETLEQAATRVESMNGDITNAVVEAEEARAAALAAADDAALAAALLTVATVDPTVADAEGKPVGAVWEVRSGGVTARRYVLTNATTWTQVKLGTDTIGDAVIGSAQIGDLDVAKLTASGTSKFQTAVMAALIADDAFLDGVYAQRVLVSARNLHPDPRMVTPSVWSVDSTSTFRGVGTGRSANSGSIELASSRFGDPVAALLPASYPAVKRGGTYRVGVWVRTDTPQTLENVATVIAAFYQGGTNVSSVSASLTTVTSEWQRLEVLATAPTAVDTGLRYQVRRKGSAAGLLFFSDPYIQDVDAGRILVDGEVGAREIRANEVSAAVGVFIDAMMQNLSVTGIANIKQVVTDSLWAKLAVVDRLQVLSSIITEDMIATGAVTAEKVVASQALIDKLITPDLMAGKVRTSMFQLGDNWRWTDDVFGAYLPVVGDQAVTDWESRVPAFEITPSGDATYTVYQEGEPTAGMQPDGTVWGTVGDFNELSVGGKPIAGVMSPYPQGMIYATALQQDVGLGVTTETRLLNAQVRMYPSRTYRVVMQVAYIDTGRVNLRVRQSASGVPVVGNALQTEIGRDGTAGGRGLIHYDYVLRSDDFTDTIPEDGLIVNIGMFVTMSGWAPATVYGAYPVSGAPGKPRTMLTVEDMGASLDMDWVTVANNVPAPAPSVSTYSKTATYKGGWGWRGVSASGAIQPNNRATVGGSLYGTAMNNLIVVGVSNMTTNLSGATVTRATVTVKRAAGGTAATVYWNVGFSSNGSPPTTGPAVTNIATNASFTVGQSRTFTLTAAQANNLRTGAFRSVVVSPTNSGNANSYGYLDVAATKVDYSYKK